MGKIFNISDDGVHRTYRFIGLNIHRRIFNKSDYRLSLSAAMQANAISKTHSMSFDQFKGCNFGKTLVLVATGPSLINFKPISNAIYVGVNKAFLFDKVSLDYLFIQDFNSKEYIYNLLKERYTNIIKFLGILPQNNLVIPESLALKLKARRYYTDEIIKPYRFTYDISTSALGDFNSVTFSAIQFMLWTNPSKIYLVGCDCSSGYFDKSKSAKSMSYLTENWIKLKKFNEIYYPDTQIISINPVGLKGIFSDLYQESANYENL